MVEYIPVTCPICNQVFLSRRGDFPLVAQLAHAVAAKSDHDSIAELTNKDWESILTRKVLPFRRSS